MFSLETTLLGVALALDAAAVSFAIGIMNFDLSKSQKIKRALVVCALFGLFQFLMIWLGSIGGYFLSFSNYGYLFQLIVALIFFAIGMSILQSSFKNEQEHIEWAIIPLVLLSLATSIDALASGISMGTLPLAYLSGLEIGLITFCICGLAFFATNFFKSFPTAWLLRIASGIFFFMSGRILMDYYL